MYGGVKKHRFFLFDNELKLHHLTHFPHLHLESPLVIVMMRSNHHYISGSSDHFRLLCNPGALE